MITGNDHALDVQADDDGYHPPTSDDPSWVETAWFPFWLPEQDTSVHLRVWFRPNAGQMGGAVTAWRDDNRYLAHDAWTEEMAGPPDLRDLRAPNGFRIECVRPLDTYHLTHSAEAVEVDVTFRSVMEPNPVAPEESPGMFDGHFEQPGRMTGRVRLRDRWFDVDCGTVRDRSWGPRTMRPGLRLGNAHGTTTGGASFFAYINPDAAARERITGGYWSTEGKAARLIDGERSTELDGDFPITVSIDAHDALGRHLVARGRCRNRQAVDAGHGLYAVLNLVEWDLGDDQHAWGENHDIWSTDDWRASGRAPLGERR